MFSKKARPFWALAAVLSAACLLLSAVFGPKLLEGKKPVSLLATPATNLVRVNTLLVSGKTTTSGTDQVTTCYTGASVITNQGELVGQTTLLDGTSIIGMKTNNYQYVKDGFQFIEMSDGNIAVFATQGFVCQPAPEPLSLDEKFQKALALAEQQKSSTLKDDPCTLSTVDCPNELPTIINDWGDPSCSWTEEKLETGSKHTLTNYAVLLVTWQDLHVTATTVDADSTYISYASGMDGVVVTIETPHTCEVEDVLRFANQYSLMAPDDLMNTGVLSGTLKPNS